MAFTFVIINLFKNKMTKKSETRVKSYKTHLIRLWYAHHPETHISRALAQRSLNYIIIGDRSGHVLHIWNVENNNNKCASS